MCTVVFRKWAVHFLRRLSHSALWCCNNVFRAILARHGSITCLSFYHSRGSPSLARCGSSMYWRTSMITDDDRVTKTDDTHWSKAPQTSSSSFECSTVSDNETSAACVTSLFRATSESLPPLHLLLRLLVVTLSFALQKVAIWTETKFLEPWVEECGTSQHVIHFAVCKMSL